MNRRVYDVARACDVSNEDVISYLRDQLGEYVRAASSVIAEPVAEQVVRHFGGRLSMPIEAVEASVTPRTPASTLTWQANPVREPVSEVRHHISRLEAIFPEAAKHRAMLQALGSQFVYADTSKAADGRVCGFALVRFSGAIESAFGLTREVLFFYSPYRDLQARTFGLAKDRLAQFAAASREVTPDLIFFSSPDDRLVVKLKDWSKLDLTLVPMPASIGPEPIELISQLRDHVYARDLFYETTPVSGSKFFGRATLLQELRDDIANQRVSGLFGLRKSGKTSILLQFARMIESESLLPVFIDLETLPSPPVDPTPEFMREIIRRLISTLSGRGVDCSDLEAIAPLPEASAFRFALEKVVQRLADRGITLVLMLDEIEFLTPSDLIDTAEANFPGVAQVLAILRAVVQSSENFTFLLSGLTNHILENGRLYGRPNPLFSWAKARYVGPFSRQEADELATAIGARMGIEIQGGALSAIYDASGGHAYLYRNLASDVVGSLPTETYRRVMRTADVLHALQPWRRAVAGNVDEILGHLSRYYPIEGLLLETLRETPADFIELAQGEDRAIHHLASLGLIYEDSGQFRASVLLELS